MLLNGRKKAASKVMPLKTVQEVKHGVQVLRAGFRPRRWPVMAVLCSSLQFFRYDLTDQLFQHICLLFRVDPGDDLPIDGSGVHAVQGFPCPAVILPVKVKSERKPFEFYPLTPLRKACSHRNS